MAEGREEGSQQKREEIPQVSWPLDSIWSHDHSVSLMVTRFRSEGVVDCIPSLYIPKGWIPLLTVVVVQDTPQSLRRDVERRDIGHQPQ